MKKRIYIFITLCFWVVNSFLVPVQSQNISSKKKEGALKGGAIAAAIAKGDIDAIAREKLKFQAEWKAMPTLSTSTSTSTPISMDDPNKRNGRGPNNWISGGKLRIDTFSLCPGEVVDVPIYMEIDTAYPLQNFMFFLDVVDTSLIDVVTSDWDTAMSMGNPILTDMDPRIAYRGQIIYNYYKKNAGNDGSFKTQFAVIWVDAVNEEEGGYRPNFNRHIFKLRIRCKEAGLARLKFDTARTAALCGGLGTPTGTYVYEPLTYTHGVIINPSGPAKDSISAGPDVFSCVNNTLQLHASGGVQYTWKSLLNANLPYKNALNDDRLQDPLFHPVEPGNYKYEVRVGDAKGCYTADTMFCFVKQNTMGVFMGEDLIIDSNSRALLSAEVQSLYPPYKVVWSPDTLFPDKGNVIEGDPMKGEALSLPLLEPTLFVASISDRYCTIDLPQRVYIKGLKVSGKIAPFPIYRCGNKAYSERTQMNVLTKGGSGQFSYNWRAEDFTNHLPVIIEDATTGHPWITYWGRCAVFVDIHDWYSGEDVTLSDTMLIKDYIEASSTLTMDTLLSGSGPFCEEQNLSYRAKITHGGDKPIFSWLVNHKEVKRNSDSVFTTQLRGGDSVAYVLYSNEQCVENTPLHSPTLSANIHYPAILTILPAFGLWNAHYDNCGDSLSLKITYTSAGNNFRVRWYRNNKLKLVDKKVHSSKESGEDFSAMPRSNYYDEYHCVVSEADMPCLYFDSVPSAHIYSKMEPAYPLQAGGLSLRYGGHGDTVCNGGEYGVVATDIENLPSKFKLTWYRKPLGTAPAVALGFYSFPYQEETPLSGINLIDYFYGSDPGDQVWKAFHAGFPLSLNRLGQFPTSLGDTLFYVIQAPAVSGCSGRVAASDTSKKFVPRSFAYSSGSLAIQGNYKEGGRCVGSPAMAVASLTGDGNQGFCTWYYNGKLITPDSGWIRGKKSDTLNIPHIQTGDSIRCIANSNFYCVRNFPLTKVVQIPITVGRPFAVNKSKDTVICKDQSVKLWATGGTTDDGSGSLVGYTTYWNDNLSDLKAGLYDGKGLSYTTSPRYSAHDRPGDGSGSLSDHMGSGYYYVKIENDVSCLAYDSIKITMAYNYPVSIRLFTDIPMPWCDTAGGISGRDGVGRYFMTEVKNGGEHAIYDWYVYGQWWVNYPDYDSLIATGINNGVEVRARVHSSILTCEPTAAVSNTLITQKVQPLMLSSGPNFSVCMGDTLLLSAYAYSKADKGGLSKYRYMWEDLGSIWDPIPGSAQAGWNGIWSSDTFSERGNFYAVWPKQKSYYRVIAQDTLGVCRAVSLVDTVKIAVPTGVDVEFQQASTGRKISNVLCAGLDSLDIIVKAIPQNKSGKAYYNFFWNGKIIYSKEDTLRLRVKENDWVGVSYVHDTISCDGKGSHTSPTYYFRRISPAYDTVKLKLFPSDTVLCEGASVKLKAEGCLSYLWSPASLLEDANKAETMAHPLSTTVYKVVAEDVYSCLHVDSIQVGVSKMGQVPELALQCSVKGEILCGKDTLRSFSIDPNKSSGFSLFSSIKWYKNKTWIGEGKGPFSIALQQGDSVYLIGKPNLNCVPKQEVYSNVLHFSLYEVPDLKVAFADTGVCAGSEVVLRALVDSGVNCSWNLVSASVSASSDGLSFKVSPLVSSLYKVSARKNAFCEDTALVKVRVIGSYDTLFIRIASEVDYVCDLDSSRVFVMDGAPSIDSVEWFIKEKKLPVKDLLASLDRMFYLQSSDSVYAKSYSHGACVYNQGQSSNKVAVQRFKRPTLVRTSPLLGDTMICSRKKALLAYLPYPPNQGVSWHWYPTLSLELVNGGALRNDSNASAVVAAPAQTTTYYVEVYSYPACPCYDSIKVTVLDAITENPSAYLRSDRSSVCGKENSPTALVTYSLEASSYDSIVWFANGLEFARDVLSVQRLPRLSTGTSQGGAAKNGRRKSWSLDSVYVQLIKNRVGCAERRSVLSNVILTERVEPPVVEILTGDTSVKEGKSIYLQAQGAEVLRWAAKGSSAVVEGATVLVRPGVSTTFVVEGYNRLYMNLEGCRSYDSVRVVVIKDSVIIINPPLEDLVVKDTTSIMPPFDPGGGMEDDSTSRPTYGDLPVIYIPNAVLVGASNAQDRVFRVYSQGIALVDMQIFNVSGSLVFKEVGPDPAWDATDKGSSVPAGNYVYKLFITFHSGATAKKQGWFTVVK